MSNYLSAPLRDVYDLAFQVSPIILTGGLSSNVSGGALPIIALLGQLKPFAEGLVFNGPSLNDFAFRYLPQPGATAINNSIATYPFASQHVAGNAYIEEPLNISLLMICPVNQKGGYIEKLALFTALRNALKKHIESGGTFAIATPSLLYDHCLLTTMTDVTNAGTKQQQVAWQIDFHRPLISRQEAIQAQNGLMDVYQGKQLNGDPSWSSGAAATGKAIDGAANKVVGLLNTTSGILSKGL